MKKQEITRFTFDCPSNLHSIVKMKAAAAKKSLKDYFLDILTKNIYEPVEFIDDTTYQKELKKLIINDQELLKKLSDK